MKDQFTISNTAGGDLRSFRLRNGQLSSRAIQHARRQGNWLCFGGPAGSEASAAHDRLLADLEAAE
jgi:hypothetical protein